MLFHKFQKVPPIFFKYPWISVSGGKHCPLKNMLISYPANNCEMKGRNKKKAHDSSSKTDVKMVWKQKLKCLQRRQKQSTDFSSLCSKAEAGRFLSNSSWREDLVAIVASSRQFHNDFNIDWRNQSHKHSRKSEKDKLTKMPQQILCDRIRRWIAPFKVTQHHSVPLSL